SSENLMVIKPLYLLADSQLFFWKSESNSLADRVRADLDSTNPKAAYIGASNGDQPEFYSLFQAAMEGIGISNCRAVPSQPSREDVSFIESADLILLSGGDTERGWRTFEQNGLKELVPRKRFDGAILIGVSAGAVQLGLGCLSNSAQPRQIDMFRFAPFYVGAHDEENDWWDLRALVNLSQSDARGIGLPAGGGAVYYVDGTLEPLRKPLIEIVKEDAKITENLMGPLDPSRQPQD
ncbi:MAG TPA: Type 1 glutamine amidotransferase-like domain-containing protein, partial [Candidatus Angelobacter sp.]|nr:Type 1 glutamine amidotransferase-like domain-containing protein [Candidatus Angelobacter sp.]